MPTAIYIFYAIVLSCWIFTLVVPVLVIRWSSRQRFLRTIIFSLIALVIAYLGITRFSVTSTTTTNGHTTTYDSRWFFKASLALCVLALVWAIWKKVKSEPRKQWKNEPS